MLNAQTKEMIIYLHLCLHMAIEIFIIPSIHTPEQVAYTEQGKLYDISI